VAVGHHRFEWLYVTGFVEPASGRTVWNVSNNISKAYFELVLARSLRAVWTASSNSSPEKVSRATTVLANLRARRSNTLVLAY
jgi:hypothetical protein